MTTQTEALKHEINLVLTDPDTNLSHGARRALDYVLGQLGALVQPERKPMVTKRENSIILHEGWDKLPNETKLYAEI